MQAVEVYFFAWNKQNWILLLDGRYIFLTMVSVSLLICNEPMLIRIWEMIYCARGSSKKVTSI